jgi:hypothetical protein
MRLMAPANLEASTPVTNTPHTPSHHRYTELPETFTYL